MNANLTKDSIKALLKTNNTFAVKGLLIVFNNQTEMEKASERTSLLNGKGFGAFDAELLTSFAKQWNARKWLSDKQLSILHNRMPKYAGQVLEALKADEEPKPSSSNEIIYEVTDIQFTVNGFFSVDEFPGLLHLNTFDELENSEGELYGWSRVINGRKLTIIND